VLLVAVTETRDIDSEARSRLADMDVSSSVYPCLEQCGHCYRQPFLVLDGQFVTADSHATLLEQVSNE
jgi:uncharacterized protein YuzB (UPF0349 family)